MTTMEDPRCMALWIKQRKLGAKMGKAGKSLLSGKAYVPVLTKQVPVERPPRADRVVTPLRRVKP